MAGLRRGNRQGKGRLITVDEAPRNCDDWGGGPLPEANVIARGPAKMLVQWPWAGEEQGGRRGE